jgi:hypothetical protein
MKLALTPAFSPGERVMLFASLVNLVVLVANTGFR